MNLTKFLLTSSIFLMPVIVSADGGAALGIIFALGWLVILVLAVALVYAAISLIRKHAAVSPERTISPDTGNIRKNILATLLFILLIGFPFLLGMLDIYAETIESFYKDIFYGFYFAEAFAVFLVGYSIYFLSRKQVGKQYFDTSIFTWAIRLFILGIIAAAIFNVVYCLSLSNPYGPLSPYGCGVLLKLF